MGVKFKGVQYTNFIMFKGSIAKNTDHRNGRSVEFKKLAKIAKFDIYLSNNPFHAPTAHTI